MPTRVVGLLIAVALATAACADDDGGTAAPTSAPPTSVAPASTTTTRPPATTTASPATTPPAEEAAGPPTTPPGIVPSPAGVASQLRRAERAIRNPDTPDAEVATQAHIQQVAYRVVAMHPGWLDPVLDALPDEFRDGALAQVAARREFIDMSGRPQDGPPDWRIVTPAPAEDLLAYYQEAEDEFDVEWEVLAAVNLVETGMGRIRGASSAGALGPMQFLPSTWERWGAGGDIEDPHDAILAAGRYLGASGASRGELEAALFQYNHDNRYVRGVLRYADVMREDPSTFRGFYHWQIYFRTSRGDLLLPEGYPDVPAASR